MDFASSTISTALGTVNGLGASIDLLSIVGVWFLLSVFGFAMGASRLDALGFSMITATLLKPFAATAMFLAPLILGLAPFIATITTIGGLLIVCYLAGLRLCDTGFVDSGGMIGSAVSALAIIAIGLALWNSAYATVWPFPLELSPIFGAQFTLWWLLGSIAILAIARQKRTWN
ncbi:hypothetical protein HY413_00890 [Candidatus Kaiserbacteria bacterium]|nr:hypothetical protein [Candidatus Kaiserbacteria bacterium]